MRLERNDYMVIARTITVTVLVYLGFRYLLPLVFPFLAAWLAAALVRPFVEWLHLRLRIPKGAGAILVLGGFLSAGAGILWWGGRVLLRQASELARYIPSWINWCEGCLVKVCGRIEKGISLEPGMLVSRGMEIMAGAGEKLSQEGVAYAIEHSRAIFGSIVRVGVIFTVIFLAAVLILTGDNRSSEKKHTLFQQEKEYLGKRLALLGHTWLRCELLSIILTCIICVVGLWVIRNPYALLIGTLIGILDAFPLFGTGTVLIPWAVICFFDREVWKGIVLLLVYGVSYGVHQFLETHMIGESMGTAPILTLASLYAGMELFGLKGLILGPAGVILIREILAIWDKKTETSGD